MTLIASLGESVTILAKAVADLVSASEASRSSKVTSSADLVFFKNSHTILPREVVDTTIDQKKSIPLLSFLQRHAWHDDIHNKVSLTQDITISFPRKAVFHDLDDIRTAIQALGIVMSSGKVENADARTGASQIVLFFSKFLMENPRHCSVLLWGVATNDDCRHLLDCIRRCTLVRPSKGFSNLQRWF